jgi:hypothetical protein
VVVLGSLSVVVAAVLPIVVLVGMLWITWDEIANRNPEQTRKSGNT